MPTKGETVQQTVEQIEAAIERATSPLRLRMLRPWRSWTRKPRG